MKLKKFIKEFGQDALIRLWYEELQYDVVTKGETPIKFYNGGTFKSLVSHEIYLGKHILEDIGFGSYLHNKFVGVMTNDQIVSILSDGNPTALNVIIEKRVDLSDAECKWFVAQPDGRMFSSSVKPIWDDEIGLWGFRLESDVALICKYKDIPSDPSACIWGAQ